MTGMFATVVLALVLLGMTGGVPVTPSSTPASSWFQLWTTSTTTAPTSTEPANDTDCPYLLWVVKENVCEWINELVEHKVLTELNRRALVTANTVCPYCAMGVYDAYPDWNNCEQFNYCLNGVILTMKCKDLGSRYFNPARKACEMYDDPSNMCLHKSVNLITG